MRKKESWLSVLKRFFRSGGRRSEANENEKNRKGKRGRRRDSSSFIPLFRKPSSVEKILGDVDKDQHKISVVPSSRTSIEPQDTEPSPPSTTAAAAAAEHAAAVLIQAVYRSRMARRHARSIRGLARLPDILKRQNVRRQTMNALKQMQRLVMVQMEIRSRRIRLFENLELRNRSRAKEAAGSDKEWDDGVVSKDESEARRRRKTEAAAKREREKTYAFSNPILRHSPNSSNLIGLRHGELLRWWNWHPPTVTPPPPPRRQTQSGFRSSLLKLPWSTADSSSEKSLTTSCPPFTLPNYMSPTSSTIARARANADGSAAKRRLSYPPTRGKWRRDSPSHKPPSSSPRSTTSATSLPTTRKPFNRFV